MKRVILLTAILSLSLALPYQTGAFEMFDVSDKIKEIRHNFAGEEAIPAVGGDPDPSRQEVNEAIEKVQDKVDQASPDTAFFAGKGINIKNGRLFLNEGYSPTWTGKHVFTKDITIKNNNPSLLLNAKNGEDFWLGNEKDVFAIGVGNKAGKNVGLSLQGSGSVRLASDLRVGGGGVIKDDLDIRELGCLTPGEVRFENNTDLDGIEKGDIFYDAGNKPYKVTGKDQSYYALKIDGQCQAEGSANIRVERNGLTVVDGNVGLGTIIPQDKLDIADGDIRLSSKTENAWIKIYAPTEAKAGIKLGTNENSEDLAQWQLYTGGKNLRIQGWETSEMVDRLVITKEGQVGINTAEPRATLDVDGFMKLEPQKEAPVECSNDTSGSVAMTKNYLLCTCNGEKWVHSYAGGSDCRWDKK